MKRRMAPNKWNNNRYDRSENHHGNNQQYNNNPDAAESDETNDEILSSAADTVEYTVKILISNQTAWSISSRNEAKISWMAEKFSSDVRLSRNDDFYPNTMERICMIIGMKKPIKDTLDWILSVNNDDNQHCSIIMLVPKTSLGQILNKGYGIQALRDRANVDIHIPENNPDCVLREVCTKIGGKKENVIDTVISIGKIILTDQFAAVCKNISYEEFNIYLKRKEHNSLMLNFASMPRIGLQSMNNNNTNWMYQQQSPMQNYQHQNVQQFQHYQRQNFINQQQQQETIEQAYQPAVYTNQLKSFYNQNNKQQYHRQHEISPFFQQNKNRLQIDIQQEQQPQQQQQQQQQQQEIQDATTPTINNQEKPVVENENDKNSIADNEKNENLEGNPIPSVTSVWRRASSDNWRFGNNRQSSNGQSNVEVIPGIM